MLRLKLPQLSLTNAVFILATVSAAEGAFVTSASTGVAGVTTLVAFVLLDGCGLAPVWAHHLQRGRRERKRAAELLAALGRPEYAARVQREVFEPRVNMSADTVVLERVTDATRGGGTVYYTPWQERVRNEQLTMGLMHDLLEESD